MGGTIYWVVDILRVHGISWIHPVAFVVKESSIRIHTTVPVVVPCADISR